MDIDEHLWSPLGARYTAQAVDDETIRRLIDAAVHARARQTGNRGRSRWFAIRPARPDLG